MKCRLHNNHCCALCAMDDIKRGDQLEARTLVAITFVIVVFIFGVAIYY